MRVTHFLIALALLLSGCFGPSEDEDGLDPKTERDGWTIQIEQVGGEIVVRQVTSSPYEADEDRDDLDDSQEFKERTDPRDPDTDGDGLLDGHNIVLDRTDARAVAWKERGIVFFETADGRWEFQGERGSDTMAHGADPKDADTDDDALSDGEEVGGYEVIVNGETRTVKTLAYIEDTDGDGLFDGLEKGLGLDPTVKDTDLDGVVDSGDIDPWTDAHMRLTVDNVTLTTDPEGHSERDMRLDASAGGVQYYSDWQTFTIGATDENPGLSSGELDVDDRGGSILRGEHNATFQVTAVSSNDDGEAILIDVFSGTTAGTKTLVGFLDVLTGALVYTDPSGARHPWPEDGVFEGDHGKIAIMLAPTR